MATNEIRDRNESILKANIIAIAKDVTRHGVKCAKDIKNEKAIHGYRVSVKKLTCVAEMDKMLELSIFNHKVFNKYKRLFDAFGVLREWDILEDRYITTSDTKLSAQFISYLHKKKNKAIFEIKKQVNNAGNLKQQPLLNNVKVGQIEYKPFHDYYLQRMQQIVQLLTTAVTEKDNKKWHRLRKQLKRCIYLAVTIGKEPHKDFVELQKLLGKWHDVHVQMIMLEKYLQKEDDKFILSFKKELKRRRKKFAKQVGKFLETVT